MPWIFYHGGEGEWVISGTQVLSQRGSDLTRSIYTLSLWIRPRGCHTAAQSNPLVALSTHHTVCFPHQTAECHSWMDTLTRLLGLRCRKTLPQVMTAACRSSLAAELSWALAETHLWGREDWASGKKLCWASKRFKCGGGRGVGG